MKLNYDLQIDQLILNVVEQLREPANIHSYNVQIIR